MKITFLETVKGTSRGVCQEGDTLSFPEAEANHYVSLGWAEDEEGNTGERTPGASGPVDPSKVSQRPS